jgi:phosphatidylserine decarboxylase
MGWFSRIESRWLTRVSMTVWQWFVDDLRLFEARKEQFESLHDCFTRQLKPGARPVDLRPGIVVSPCDAEVGAMGDIHDGQLFQAKGLDYSLKELLIDEELAARYRDGRFVTLRLKSSMYHRFHAPMACRPEYVRYVSGDVWNVNPPTLRCLERVFCKNERAVVPLSIQQGGCDVTLVAVAAVLVASIRLHGIAAYLDRSYQGPRRIEWKRAFRRGDEMGYFEHGSTIIVLSDRRLSLHESLRTGDIIRMGRPLFTRPD